MLKQTQGDKLTSFDFLNNGASEQVSDKEGIGTIVVDYFNNLFSQSNGEYSGVIDLI